LGGGGGSGHANNGTATGSTNGGGMVIIKTGAIIGNYYSILANGNDNLTVSGQDGAGGAGAGGTVLLDVQIFCTLNVSVNGGRGGYQDFSCCEGNPHGPGGGGGGGIIWSSSSFTGINASFTGGAEGLATTDVGVKVQFGATAGMNGNTLIGLVLQGSNGLPSCYTSLVECPPLPIEMLSFKIVCSSGKPKLQWSTASESNNDYFTVERAVHRPLGGWGALGWASVGTVKGAGNSSMTTNYTFTDAAPADGISYYRIKQTDYNGSSTVSNIVSYNKNVCGVSVYPNPFDETLYVSIGTGIPVNALFRIVNVLGQEVCLRNIIIPGDGTSIEINLPLLASGMYVVLVNDTDNSTLLLNTKVVRTGVRVAEK
ncbi:MAG: T9SS type A sorting domain-containing protein, partial [Bacteroidetes bacterium]|nr:T9SS type A sorting domain-containing protein [Bacteroidota bacterium]